MAKIRASTLSFPVKAFLREKVTSAKVQAVIRPMTVSDLEHWKEWPFTDDDQDTSWEWDKILKESRGRGSLIECYALLTNDRLQGLVSLDTAGHATGEGRALVVDYVSSNPANRRGPDAVKDVGRVFIGFAVHRSKELGFEGRLWLESLSNAETFYDRIGFSKLPGRSKEGHVTYELGTAQANVIWQGMHDDKTIDLPDDKT
ncbi:MAG: hypothetical protein ABL955_02050 [Elusimicrobiota bacterium]